MLHYNTSIRDRCASCFAPIDENRAKHVSEGGLRLGPTSTPLKCCSPPSASALPRSAPFAAQAVAVVLHRAPSVAVKHRSK